MKQNRKLSLALFIALLFHVCGFIGIVFTPYKTWFIQHTPLTLSIMAVLIWFTQQMKQPVFYLFAAVCFITGFIVEIIGIHTGFLFGHYAYGQVFGYKVAGVPLLIGLNWFLIVFCSNTVIQQLNNWLENRLGVDESIMTDNIKKWSRIFDAAFLAVVFDYILEPAAMKLGFWNWQNNHIPLYNYTCWFLIAGLLSWLFNRFSLNKINQFAIHLFLIQSLFFLALRIFL